MSDAMWSALALPDYRGESRTQLSGTVAHEQPWTFTAATWPPNIVLPFN